MSILKSLKLAEELSPSAVDPVLAARTRILGHLGTQLKCAEAMVNGSEFMVTHNVQVTDPETGKKETKQIKKPVRKWYWRDPEGNVRMVVKNGNKAMEIGDGKTNIIVGKDDDLPGIVKKVMEAVEAGELDAQIKKTTKAPTPKKK